MNLTGKSKVNVRVYQLEVSNMNKIMSLESQLQGSEISVRAYVLPFFQIVSNLIIYSDFDGQAQKKSENDSEIEKRTVWVCRYRKDKKQECCKEIQKMCQTIEKKKRKRTLKKKKMERNENRMKITRGKV